MTGPIPELSLDEAWNMISAVPESVLIDVRTVAEWAYVGQPDLTSIGKQARFVEWVRFPDGMPNPAFVAEATADLEPDHPILLICRSGVRSRAAAEALVAAGYSDTYNITEGFEGDLDPSGQRRTGWKGAGLPWRQS